MDDPFDLDRFVKAQDQGIYERALAELRAGRKQSHWMWFIFPQLQALGRSPMAHHYGISCLEEAQAYVAHPLLGLRLDQCVEAMLALSSGPTLNEVFGSPDDLKFRSCMTLFAIAAPHGSFQAALDRWCGGLADERTQALL